MKIVVNYRKAMKYFGCLGYKAGENKYDFATLTGDKVNALFDVFHKIAGFVFVDCTDEEDDFISQIALRNAHEVVMVLSPDLKSMVYLASNEEHFGKYAESAIRVMNVTENEFYSPVDDVRTNVKNISYNVKKSGTVKTFYIPIKPVVHRTQVQATGYEGSVVAYNGSSGASGKLYSGQHIKISYKYTADNTWSATEYLRGAMYSYNGSKWANVYISNNGCI